MKNLYPIYFCLILFVLGTGNITGMGSFILFDLNVANKNVSLIQSIYYLGILIGSLFGHKILNIFKVRNTLLMSILLASLSYYICHIQNNYLFWPVLRFILGISIGLFYLITESMLFEIKSDMKVGYRFSLYILFMYIAQGLSQLSLDYVHQYRFFVLMIHAGFILISTLCALKIPFTNNNDFAKSIPDQKYSSLIRTAKFYLFAPFISGLYLSMLFSSFPLFIQSQGLSPGLFTMLLFIGGPVFQFPFMFFTKYIKHKNLLLVSILVITPLLRMIGVSSSITLNALLIVTLGGFVFSIYPLAFNIIVSKVENEGSQKMTGLIIFNYGLGSLFGPYFSL